MTAKMVKWLASFADPEDADKFLKEQAKVLKRLGMTPRFTVGIRTCNYDKQHHVELWERQ